MANEVPNSVLGGVTHTVVRDGKITAILSIDRVENYDTRATALLSGIYFRKFDRDGKMVTEAWADTSVYRSDSGNAHAEGSVIVSSQLEDVEIMAEGLRWHDKERRLIGNDGTEVILTRSDGSIVIGVDFEADIARRVIRFLGPVSGRWMVDQ